MTTTKTAICPECGRTCANPQGLAAHRRSAHGVPGSSGRTGARKASTNGHRRRRGTPRRNLALAEAIQAIFPKGIPTDDVDQLVLDLALIDYIRSRA